MLNFNYAGQHGISDELYSYTRYGQAGMRDKKKKLRQ